MENKPEGFIPHEKETIINMNDACDVANVYSCQRTVWTRMKKLGYEPYEIHQRVSGKIEAKEYEIPVKGVLLRRPTRRQYSDEQRSKLAARMREISKKRVKTKDGNRQE